ncbi:uncharacterized protein SOCE26_071000 [Sorangium cellulosum]|uniref:Uncharacterized protein n=1 Tax=Sorangium cellulosum TaxID=56 RepID=A0A2L0F212_SORCE|nr:hypothetical protein [Sorangium cellulosum]AUX45605.1 uncharacterized protein SOCE26_071000 [Sorangium cellulosum]
MRSFYVFFCASEDNISAWLESIAQRTPDARQWNYPSLLNRVLYIELSDDLYDELEPDTVRALTDHFRGERPRIVCVDVSRHFPAEREVQEFAVAILRRFGGVVMDDESDHCWTLEEIDAGATHQGRRFFGVSGAA